MINSNVATVELAGAIEAVEFSASYSYYWLDNQSSDTVYASIGELSAEADGTYTIPAGGKLRIAGGMFPGKINLLGSGKVQIIATNTAVSPFRGVGSSGGGEIPTFCYDGIVGFFDTASADISNGIWRNGIDGYNDITLNGGTIEDNSLKALGGDIGDFTIADTPKVIYIVLKKNDIETSGQLIGLVKTQGETSTSFALWQNTTYNYHLSQEYPPYIATTDPLLNEYHCFALARQTKTSSDGENGVMLFVDGQLLGFLTGNLYKYYAGAVSILRYSRANGNSYLSICEYDTFIRSIAIGTQEHNIQQIIQNSNYLMHKYM